MEQQRRILSSVKNISIALLYLALVFIGFNASLPFTLGVFAGGLIVTLGFHYMCHTLKKALTPPYKTEIGPALTKFYLKFAVIVALLTLIIKNDFVHPLGLVIGISVVPISFLLAAVSEFIIILYSKK
jgi:hypothetical protein